jgi:hypothetical protein
MGSIGARIAGGIKIFATRLSVADGNGLTNIPHPFHGSKTPSLLSET